MRFPRGTDCIVHANLNGLYVKNKYVGFTAEEDENVRLCIAEMLYYEARRLVCTAPASRWWILDAHFDDDAAAVRKRFADTGIVVRTGASFWESIDPF